MKLAKFIVKKFSEEIDHEIVVRVKVPQNSVFYKMKILPDGIYAFYRVIDEYDPNVPFIGGRDDKYTIISTGYTIPVNAEFIDILDVLVGQEDGNQATILFPIFKIE